MAQIRAIAVQDLVVDLVNPRYTPRSSQREAITHITQDQGKKLLKLAEDIVDYGLNPTRRVLVEPQKGGGYVVLEGNRRLAVLKLLLQQELRASLDVSASVKKRLQELADQAEGTLPTEVDCAITTREDANHWIHLEHTGENEGVGVVGWDSAARHRFLGGSPALQAVELVAPHLDAKTQALLPGIATTNIERVLNTPEARDIIGVDLVNKKLILKDPEQRSLARLAEIVSDVAHRAIRVTSLLSKDQRVKYAQQIAARPSTALKSAPRSNTPATKRTGRPARRQPVERHTLIPRGFSVAIKQPRINRIHDELRKLDLRRFVNSGAVLLRVFVELSAEDYASRHNVSLKVPGKSKPGGKIMPTREMKLKEKLTAVADSLLARKLCTSQELRGVRTIVSNKDHPLAVDSWHAWVHNKHYSPSLNDLTRTWDNLEPFVVGLWA
jgi:hypothetical protein